MYQENFGPVQLKVIVKKTELKSIATEIGW